LEWLQRIRLAPRHDPELGSSSPSVRGFLPSSL